MLDHITEFQPGTAQFCVPLQISYAESADLHSTPVRMTADFGELSGGQVESGWLDPHTIRVERHYADGRKEVLPVRFEEHLYYGNQGWVAWRVRERSVQSRFFLAFDKKSAAGVLQNPPYMPPVGVGEELLVQGVAYSPLFVPGMHPFPIPADVNGTGTVDLISSSHYSNVLGMPWASLFYWKNTGSNAEPRYAVPMRMKADGVDVRDPFPETFSFLDGDSSELDNIIHFAPRRDFISEYYMRVDLFDWFGTGRLDLISISRDGGIRVYRNTGRMNPDGTPGFELAVKIPMPKCVAPGMPGIRVVDYDGTGRGSIILTCWNLDHNLEYGQLLIMHRTGGTAEAPEFTLRTPVTSNYYNPGRSRFTIDADADWHELANFGGERAWSFDFFDVDGDGKPELLNQRKSGSDRGLVEVWKFVGTPEKPILEHAGLMPVPVEKDIFSFSFRMVRNAAYDGCIVSSRDEIRYFRRVKENMMEPGAFEDAGPLLEQRTRLQPAGYTRPWPVPGRNGLTDLLMGDEAGFIFLARNVGTADKPCFSAPERLRDTEGNVLHFHREKLVHDWNIERGCGQLKPCAGDWDGDGSLDILVTGNTNKIIWLDDVDLANGTVGKVSLLKVVEGTPIAWRKSILMYDVDGDGVPELLAVNCEQEFSWYKQAGTPGELREWKKCVYEDGTVINSNDVPPGRFNDPPAIFDFADWFGTGKKDLYMGTNFHLVKMEACDDSMTCFKRPELISGPDGMIYLGLHENQVAFADLDGDGIPELLVGAESGFIHVFDRDWLAGKVNTATAEK